MKTVLVCVLLSLLSLGAYVGLTAAQSGPGQPISESPPDLAMYMFWHATWNESDPAPAVANLNMCPE